jgi:hypothetical protein
LEDFYLKTVVVKSQKDLHKASKKNNYSGVCITSEVETISESSFEKKLNLTKVISYANSIQKKAFKGCSALREVWGDTNIICEEAFMNCCDLDMFNFQEVYSIKDSAFAYSGLKRIELGRKLVDIGDSAFFCCRELKEAVILNAEHIGKEAFAFSALEYVVLPKDLVEIKEKAFDMCYSLKHVICLNENPPKIEKNSFNTLDNVVFYVPSQEAVNKYKKKPNWKKFNYKVIDWSSLKKYIL